MPLAGGVPKVEQVLARLNARETRLVAVPRTSTTDTSLYLQGRTKDGDHAEAGQNFLGILVRLSKKL